MTYQIYKPTGSTGTNPILVADNAIDTSLYDSINRVGLQLVGRNAVNYGTAVAQNSVQLTSNFAGTVYPTDAIALQGQMWYDTSTDEIYLRTGATSVSAPFATNWTKILLDGGTFSGNAATATALQTPRNFSISGGDAAAGGTVSFDGTANVVLSLTIASNAVSNAKLAQVSTARLKGRVTAGLGDVEDLTGTQATSLLDTFTSGLKGLAPASGGGTVNFLRADGTWAAPIGGGGGTVTSVSVTTANGVSGSVLNPTTTPAITLTLGAITPSSVAATGTVTGTNISGTNTGDQTITLTGAVTGSGTGSFATTYAGNLPVSRLNSGTGASSSTYWRGDGTWSAPLDYSTGVFTPGLSFGGSSTGITYSFQAAAYTVIGNTVFVGGLIILSNKGSQTGKADITDLPFLPTGQVPMLIMGNDFDTLGGVVQGYALATTPVIELRITDSSGSITQLTNTSFTDSTRIHFSGTYRI